MVTVALEKTDLVVLRKIPIAVLIEAAFRAAVVRVAGFCDLAEESLPGRVPVLSGHRLRGLIDFRLAPEAQVDLADVAAQQPALPGDRPGKHRLGILGLHPRGEE